VRALRWTATAGGLLALLVALAVLLFIGTQCVGTGGAGRGQEIPAAAAGVPGYLRPGADSYLALPRWYVAYSAEEHAAFLVRAAPSGFPHLGALRQYWRYYRAACAVTRHRYPFDAGKHFLLGLAGVGFSAEHAARGAYEATVGRASEWLGGHDTAEDAFARRTAQEYARFLRTRPWYDFPFAGRAEALWNDTPLWGPELVRKWERRWVLTGEYGVKAIYGWLAALAARDRTGEDREIHLWVENVPPRALADPRIQRVRDIARGSYLLRIPRGEAFTEIVAALARQGARVREIAGNDEIFLTVRARGPVAAGEGARVVLDEPILTAPELRRVGLTAPVRSLHAILPPFARAGVTLERLYDY